MKIKTLIFILFQVQWILGQTTTADLYVCFTKDAFTKCNGNPYQCITASNKLSDFQPQFEVGLAITKAKLEQMKIDALRKSGTVENVEKLERIFKIEISNPTEIRLLKVRELLEQLNSVAYVCSVSNEPIVPPSDIPPATPNYEPLQTYIQSNPGLNMQYAWNLNYNGQGIKIRDVEYGFNANHEDLTGTTSFIFPGMTISSSATTDYTEHGTGVFGIVFGDKGGYGISGLAYGATEMVLFPEWQQSGYNRIYAISQGVANSTIGDVIIFEMQENGPDIGSTDYVMAEYNQLVWDLTKAATDAGITVVAAAGNGGVNLDSTLFDSYHARGNSGAIIVGAGTANLAHNRIFYSTYGSRVDLQGWGENVISCGNIGLLNFIQIGGDPNQSYLTFTGTSSATAMIAGCASVLQSFFHAQTGDYLSPQQIRQVLHDTGWDQGDSAAGSIGPLPNMQAAIESIIQQLSTAELQNQPFLGLYPNPATDFVTVYVATQPNNQLLQCFDAFGKQVLDVSIANQYNWDISDYASGVYFVRLTSEQGTVVKKIIKQ